MSTPSMDAFEPLRTGILQVGEACHHWHVHISDIKVPKATVREKENWMEAFSSSLAQDELLRTGSGDDSADET